MRHECITLPLKGGYCWRCHMESDQHIVQIHFLAEYLDKIDIDMPPETSRRHEGSSCKNSHQNALKR